MRNAKKALFFIVYIGFIAFFNAQVMVVKQKQTQLKRLENEVNSLKSLIQSTEQGQQASLGKYEALNELVSLRKQFIQELKNEVVDLEYTLGDSEDLIAALSNDLDSLKSDYADMVYSTAKMNHSFDRLFLIFSSQSYNQLTMRLKFLNQFAQIKREQVEKIVLVQKTLKSEKQIVSSKYSDKKQALNKIVEEKSNLSLEMEQANKEYEALKFKEKDLNKQLKNKKREIQLIKSAIEEMLKKPEINISILSKNFSANKGRLPWPVKSAKFVSWRYGVQAHPTIKNVEINNLGMGIQTQSGTAVYAAFEGEVRKVLNIPGSGQTIMVKHGEYFTVYGHMQNVIVTPGSKISTGQKLGEVMEVNESNALDFQIWHKQENLNPQSWLIK